MFNKCASSDWSQCHREPVKCVVIQSNAQSYPVILVLAPFIATSHHISFFYTQPTCPEYKKYKKAKEAELKPDFTFMLKFHNLPDEWN